MSGSCRYLKDAGSPPLKKWESAAAPTKKVSTATRSNSSHLILPISSLFFSTLTHQRAELEDRQIHRDDQSADDDAEHDHDDRLHQSGQIRDGVVDLVFVKLGHLLEQRIERAGVLADRNHLADHGRKNVAFGERLGHGSALADADP